MMAVQTGLDRCRQLWIGFDRFGQVGTSSIGLDMFDRYRQVLQVSSSLNMFRWIDRFRRVWIGYYFILNHGGVHPPIVQNWGRWTCVLGHVSWTRVLPTCPRHVSLTRVLDMCPRHVSWTRVPDTCVERSANFEAFLKKSKSQFFILRSFPHEGFYMWRTPTLLQRQRGMIYSLQLFKKQKCKNTTTNTETLRTKTMEGATLSKKREASEDVTIQRLCVSFFFSLEE